MADKTAEQLSVLTADEANPAMSQLSAIVDDELEDVETELVLRRLSRDRDLRERWERYHLLSDVLQGHLPAAFDADFAARIHHAIEAESLSQPVTRPLPSWYKPVTGFALAASVVLVALFGLKLTQTDSALVPTAQLAVTAPPPSVISVPIRVAAAPQQPVDNPNEPVDSRLSSYLVNHNGYASMNSVHGMLPYVRMVGYQTSR